MTKHFRIIGLHFRRVGTQVTVNREVFFCFFDYVERNCGAMVHNTLEAGNDLEVMVFPGKDNGFTLYEDGGDGSEFENGEFVKTEMSLEWGESPIFTVKPAKGALELLPKERNYEFHLRGFHKNVSVKVMVDGKESVAEVVYDEATRSIIVKMVADVTSEIKLMITGETFITDNGDAMKRCSELMQKSYSDMGAKEDMMRILQEQDTPFKSKLRKMNFRLANSIEHQGLIEALLEQLTLVE